MELFSPCKQSYFPCNYYQIRSLSRKVLINDEEIRLLKIFYYIVQFNTALLKESSESL